MACRMGIVTAFGKAGPADEMCIRDREYHERFWKSELIDFVILQQDAFDEIDANCPIERQKMMRCV